MQARAVRRLIAAGGKRLRAEYNPIVAMLRLPYALFIAAALLSTGGCSAPVTSRDVTSYDPRRRALAIRMIANSNDKSQIPRLVERLEDNDQAVRMFAILALERMTGRQSDYKYYLPPTAQPAAIEEWRELGRGLVRERAMGVAEGPEAPRAGQSVNGPNESTHAAKGAMR